MSDLAVVLVVVVAFVWLVWRMIRRGSRLKPSAAIGHRFETECVGESFYKRNLRKLYPIRGEDDGEDEFETTAALRIDNENKHDPKAVAVLIKGLQVAHLSREDARRFRQQVGQPKHGLEFSVPARVWVPDDEDESHSVSVNVDGAHL